jgi:hypothetical protein
MTTQNVLVTIACILAIFGNLPYIKDVMKGKISPHPFTWFIWSIVSLVTFFGAWQKGAGLGAIPIFVSEVFTFIIFLLSLKNASKNSFKDIDRKDFIFLIIALIGLIPWYFTKDPTVSVVIVVCIDLMAFVPTLVKTYRDSTSENPILFASNVIRHILIMFSLDAYNIATTFHSICMIISNALMIGVIFKKYFGFPNK